MNQRKRLKGARIVNELVEQAVQKKNRTIVSKDWLPDPEFEPAKVNSSSYMLVVDLGDSETLDFGFSMNDLEEIQSDSYLRQSTEKYIDTMLSKL